MDQIFPQFQHYALKNASFPYLRICGSYLTSQTINFLKAQLVIVLSCFPPKTEHNVLHRIDATLIFYLLKVVNSIYWQVHRTFMYSLMNIYEMNTHVTSV